MKIRLYLLPIVTMLLCTAVVAQKANIDSLTLVAQISQDQLKLGKLQNMVEQKTKNKEGAAVDAQNSASDNANAAERLNADPDNKKLANDANNKAGDAKSNAKKSRNESGKLDDLNKQILDLKVKIAGEQSKLSVFSPNVAVSPVIVPPPVIVAPPVIRPDTTQHP